MRQDPKLTADDVKEENPAPSPGLSYKQIIEQKAGKLNKSEERYRKMIEEVEDYAIFMLDKNGIIQNWNKGAEKIKGYKEEEIIGKNFWIFYTEEDQNAGLP